MAFSEECRKTGLTTPENECEKDKLRHSAKTTDVLASGYWQKGQDSSAAEAGNCTKRMPRPSEIRPVTSTQTAETRSICRRDECDSREPPTPVRIMIGAVPAPKASIVSSPWMTLAELLARVRKP